MRNAAIVLCLGACLQACTAIPGGSEAARGPDWVDERVAAGRPGYPALRDIPEIPEDWRSAEDYQRAAEDLEEQRAVVLRDPMIAGAEGPRDVEPDEFVRGARDRVRRDVEALDASDDPSRQRN